MTRRIVLVGGGYVTLHACIQLRRRLRAEIRRGEVEIVVVSADTAHNFHGFTGEVLAGLMPVERTRTLLTSACGDVRIIHGIVTEVDPAGRTVTVRPADGRATEQLAYHQLIIGAGAREPIDNVPGLGEFGYTLRAPGELARFTAAIAELTDSGAGAQTRVVVAGGGLAGVEMAAAIADRGRGRLTVELVHSGKQVLPVLRAEHPSLARRADRELDRLGVRVRPGIRLAAVTPDGAVLSDGTVLAASAVLGTIGLRPVALRGLDPSWLDAVGRLVTAADLRVTDGIWAAGDAARVHTRGNATPVPANALWAIKAGAHAGRNVARVVRGRSARPFRYRGLGQAASFGVGRSIAELYGVPFTGVLAWVLRLTFFLRFLPSRRRVPTVLGDVAQTLRGRRVGSDGRWTTPDAARGDGASEEAAHLTAVAVLQPVSSDALAA